MQFEYYMRLKLRLKTIARVHFGNKHHDGVVKCGFLSNRQDIRYCCAE